MTEGPSFRKPKSKKCHFIPFAFSMVRVPSATVTRWGSSSRSWQTTRHTPSAAGTKVRSSVSPLTVMFRNAPSAV